MSPVDPELAALSRTFLAQKDARLRAELEHDEAQQERRRRNSETSRARVREQLKASGVDEELLKRHALTMKEELEVYKQQVRPQLIGRASDYEADIHRARGLLTLSIPGLDLIVSEAVGVRTLPATQNQPGEIRMAGSETGDGSGWGLWQTYPVHLVSFWFHLIPTRTAMWTLQALTQYRGFYVVRADDEAWTSKEAWVRIRTQLSVVQHAWSYGDWTTFCEHGDDNIDETAFIDELSQLQLQVPLQAGDLAVVYVDAWLETEAQGDGSYAELNFKDGAANYIKPLALLAWPGS